MFRSASFGHTVYCTKRRWLAFGPCRRTVPPGQNAQTQREYDLRDLSKRVPIDEAVAFLRGHAATGTPITNPNLLFYNDYMLCCDEEKHLRPDSYYGSMPSVEYKLLYRSMTNAKELWDGWRELDAETLLIALLERSYYCGECVDERIIRDFVKCAVRWRPHSLEAYRYKE